MSLIRKMDDIDVSKAASTASCNLKKLKNPIGIIDEFSRLGISFANLIYTSL